MFPIVSSIVAREGECCDVSGLDHDDFTALTGDPTAHVDVPLMSIRGLEGRSGQMGMHYLFRHGRYPIMVEEQQGDGWEVVGDR